MSFSLEKGQQIDLKKSSGDSLKNLIVGLGWDVNQQQENKGLYETLFVDKDNFDCDASAVLCVDGKFKNIDDLVFFGNLEHVSGSVIHQGDNLTGEGDGDDEQISVMLDKVPAEYDKIVFIVNIYECEARNLHFGMINNAFIRIVDADSGEEFCKFDLTDDYSGKTALIAGEVYKKDGTWKFNALGQGTNDKTVIELADRYL